MHKYQSYLKNKHAKEKQKRIIHYQYNKPSNQKLWTRKEGKNKEYSNNLEKIFKWTASVHTFFFFGSIGAWTQDPVPARQTLYHLSHTSSFYIGYFWSSVSLYAQFGLDYDPPIYASPVAGKIIMCYIGWDGVLWNFCLDWLWTVICWSLPPE
jgi:hypothetical protein